MSIKFLVLGGGGYFGFGGGGSADFIFMGAGIFLKIYGHEAFSDNCFIRNNRKEGYRKLTFAHVRQAQCCVWCTV